MLNSWRLINSYKSGRGGREREKSCLKSGITGFPKEQWHKSKHQSWNSNCVLASLVPWVAYVIGMDISKHFKCLWKNNIIFGNRDVGNQRRQG